MNDVGDVTPSGGLAYGQARISPSVLTIAAHGPAGCAAIATMCINRVMSSKYDRTSTTRSPAQIIDRGGRLARLVPRHVAQQAR